MPAGGYQPDLDSRAECGSFISQESNDDLSNSAAVSDLGDTSYLKIGSEMEADCTPQSTVSSTDELNTSDSLNSVATLVKSTYTDLNKCVSDLIKLTEVDSEFGEQIIPITDSAQVTRKRLRKSVFQLKKLSKMLKRTPHWDKPHMNYVAKQTGLQYQQVYKWYWDQQHKTIRN